MSKQSEGNVQAEPNYIAATARQQVDSMLSIQKNLLELAEDMNQYWSGRARSEVELSIELANKIASARSVPDLTDVYRDWLGHRLQHCLNDSNRILVGFGKLIKAGNRIAENGKAAN
jgi:hypothetical protein